ncbi:MAG: hypothetical protein CL832_04870 [Crocinitomicaceae bacterium]|nr:hypothetical protein [Crocinitomicaceae bacterium]
MLKLNYKAKFVQLLHQKTKQNERLNTYIKYFFSAIILTILFSCTKDRTNNCSISPTYSNDLVPIFNSYCISCHQGNNISGGVLLDNGSSVEQHINKIISEIEIQTMPPYGMPTPTDSERDSIIIILNCWLENKQ